MIDSENVEMQLLFLILHNKYKIIQIEKRNIDTKKVKQYKITRFF